MSVRDEMTFGIIVAAVEGGINYWAKVREYHWSDITNEARVQVLEAWERDATWQQIDQPWVEKALEKIRQDKDIEIREDILENILLADHTDGRKGDLDAEAADVIFQIGLFGEIVYG